MIRNHFSDDEIIAEEEDVRFIDKNSQNLVRQCFHELDVSDLNDIKKHIAYRGNLSQRQWTVDPIDGTIGYQKGLSYAIGVGFMLNKLPKICAIAVPNYNDKPLAIFSAREGEGARVSYGEMDFKPVRVSKTKSIKKIIFLTIFLPVLMLLEVRILPE